MRVSKKCFVAAAVLWALVTGHAQATETFTILQDKPNIIDKSNEGTGPTHGDILVFEATFKGDNGTKGIIMGVVHTVRVPSGTDRPLYDRIDNIVADFGGEDTLVVLGLTKYPKTPGQIISGMPMVRAITGGTGRFLGARGQVTTIRREDGTYQHVIILL